jgi:AraC-like DNA-binding protein
VDKHLTFEDTRVSPNQHTIALHFMALLIRSSILEGYKGLAKTVGIDAAQAMHRVQLNEEALDNPELFISFLAVIRLLELTATDGNCPDFGRRLSQLQDRSFSGPLTVLMRHAPTMAEALDVGTRNLFVLSPTARFERTVVREAPYWTDLVVSLNVPARTAHAQAMEQSLVFMVQILRELSHGKVRPQLALLPHKQLGDLPSYRKAFECDCKFETPFAAIRIATKDLELPLPDRNPLMLQMAQNYIDQNFGAPQQVVTENARMAIRKLLEMGSLSLPRIAKSMSMHTKTLQRRLQSEGVQFETLLDEVRRDQFLNLMDQPQPHSLAHIALMVGYSEQASLTRSCYRWFRCSPSEMRKRLELQPDTEPNLEP